MDLNADSGQLTDDAGSPEWIALFGFALAMITGVTCALGLGADLDKDALLPIGAIGVLCVTWLGARHLGLERASLLALAAAAPGAIVARASLGEEIHYVDSFELGAFGATFLLPLIIVPSFGFTALATMGFTCIPLGARHSAVRWLGCLALGAAVVTSALAVAKRASHPDIAGLRATVEQLWPHENRAREASSVPARATVAGSTRLTAAPDPTLGCILHLNDGAGGDGTITYLYPYYDAKTGCEGVHLFHVPPERLWIATKADKLGPAYPKGFIGPHFVAHGTTWDSVARNLGPSVASIATAIVGVLFALATLLRRDRALEERLTWREESHGEVTRLVSPRAHEAGYRGSPDDVDPAFVAVGSHAELRERWLRARTAQWAFATLVVMLTAAPLFVAATLGFVT